MYDHSLPVKHVAAWKRETTIRTTLSEVNIFLNSALQLVLLTYVYGALSEELSIMD